MKRKAVLVMCVVILALGGSCRMVETLAGGESAGTVDRLWSDVPALDGAEKADLAIPLGARLLIRTVMQGKVNFIAFTSNRSADEVREFYGKERMASNGWKPAEQECVGDKESDDTDGAVCLYERKDGNKEEGLAIIVAEDTKNQRTDIFYVRIDITPESTNSDGADRAQYR